MPQLRHAWLFEPGTWTATGRFWEKGEIERDGHGTSIVRHTTDMWAIAGTMEILGEPPARFQNVYSIPVPHAGARIVPWESHNPAIGPLRGIFFVADDTIMSSFQSSDGEFVGEHMTSVAPDRYQPRGLFLASGAIVSAWSMALVRKP
ncbi:MAG: hypothetical protein ACREIR_20865 [Geminicoccaceae bacterium]